MPILPPRIALALACCASGLIAAACASTAPDGPHSALAGTRWIAQLIDGRAVSERPPQIVFTAHDRVQGTGGCNALAGVYEAADGAIDLRGLARTEMACDASVMRQEDAFVAVLDKASHYSQDGERLIITADDGRTLVFRAA
ncbi:MAG: META domain-containing protein [Hyphomonadaceae bacterium]